MCHIPSPPFLARLKKSEGFRAKPYLCPAGRVTIGYGHNLETHPESLTDDAPELVPRIRSGKLRGKALLAALNARPVWTREDAEARLIRDLESVMEDLSARCPAYRHLINLAGAATAGGTEAAAGNPDANAARCRAEVLIDMAFNMGTRGLMQFQATLDAVRADDYPLAASRMLESAWAGQVPGRAKADADCMRTGRWAR